MNTAKLLLLTILLATCIGCTRETHQAVGDKAVTAKEVVDGIKGVVGSEAAKAAAAAIATIPIPVAQIVPVARDRVEWGLGILSTVLGIAAAWQLRKAKEQELKKNVYKDNSSKTELDAANKQIYGSEFDPKLSKF